MYMLRIIWLFTQGRICSQSFKSNTFKNSTFDPRRTPKTPPTQQKKLGTFIFVSPSSISFNVFAARLPVCALWLFCDKTELFGREFCDRGQNIVLRVIFSSGGLATSVNRTLSKPDPQQTLPLPPAWSLILVAKKLKKLKVFSANLFCELPLYINPAASDAD